MPSINALPMEKIWLLIVQTINDNPEPFKKKRKHPLPIRVNRRRVQQQTVNTLHNGVGNIIL